MTWCTIGEVNKNGVVAVVVVVVAVVLVGLWAMRSGDQTAGVDCSAPPAVPENVTHTKAGDVVTVSWAPASSSDHVTNYLVDAKTASDPAPTVFLAPGRATTFQRQAPPATYYVHVSARNACGTSAPSREMVVTVP